MKDSRKGFYTGCSDFKSVITGGYLYFDKTLFIKSIIDNTEQVKLIIRPRRFGKTLNMTMLDAFFRKSTKVDNISLFTPYKIWNAGDSYQGMQGEYPVIFLTFKDIKTKDFVSTYEKVKVLISELYKTHKDELNDYLKLKKNEADAELYQRTIDENLNQARVEKSIHKLSQWLEDRYGKKVVILVDEYDMPFSAKYPEICSETQDFMRQLLGTALKDNSHLYQGVLTGVLPIAKDGLLSGWNNISTYTMFSDDRYDAYFGLLPEEIDEMIGQGQEKIMSELGKWYGGYHTRNYQIYNTWSIIKFLNDYSISKAPPRKQYWIESAKNDLVERLLNSANEKVKEDCKKLVQNETIKKTIKEHVEFADINRDENTLWSFLFLTGYVSAEISEDTSIDSVLFIPNKEIHLFFRELVRYWFKDEIIEIDFEPTIFEIKDPDPGVSFSKSSFF